MTLADTEIVTIRKSELDRLEAANLKLECLLEAGVENWSSYEDAMLEYRKLLDEKVSND